MFNYPLTSGSPSEDNDGFLLDRLWWRNFYQWLLVSGEAKAPRRKGGYGVHLMVTASLHEGSSDVTFSRSTRHVWDHGRWRRKRTQSVIIFCTDTDTFRFEHHDGEALLSRVTVFVSLLSNDDRITWNRNCSDVLLFPGRKERKEEMKMTQSRQRLCWLAKRAGRRGARDST